MSSSQQSFADPPGVFFSVSGDNESLQEKIDNQEYRNRLRAIVADEEKTSSEKLQSILQLGAEWFGVNHGHLVRIDPADGSHTIVEVSGSHPEITPGATTDLSSTYCRTVIAENDAMALTNAAQQGWDEDPAYETFSLSTYLGAKVVISEELYGTACFVDQEPRGEPFGEADAAALALIVRTISQELERSRRRDRLRRTHARLETLFEESPAMINIHDEHGNLVVPNPRLCEKTGYDEEELVGLKVWDLDKTLDADEARDIWQDMTPGDRHRRESEYRRKDGSTFPVEVDMRCIDSEGNNRFVAISRDITSRKTRERELQQEKERFRTLVQEVEEYAIFMLGPEGRIQSWNEGARRIKGYEENEVLGQSLSIFYTDDDRAAGVPEANLDRATRKGSVQAEGWRVRKDGSRFWADVTITALYDDHGSLRGFAKVTRDMTERMIRERELRNRERQLKHIRENITDVIWISPVDTSKVEFVSDAYEEIWGRPKDQLKAEPNAVMDAIHPDDRDRVQEALRLQKENPDAYDETYRIVHPDGEIRWVHDKTAGVYDEEDQLRRIVGVATDITERKEAERELRETHHLLEKTFESLREAVVLVDPTDRRIVMCNEATEEIFGYGRDELIGASTKLLHVDDESFRRFGERSAPALDEDEYFSGEYQMRRKDGQIIDTEHRLTPLRGDERPDVVVSVIRDITNRKNRERVLKEREEKVEALYTATSQLLRAESEDEVGRSILTLINEVFGYRIVAVRFLKEGQLVPLHISPEIPEYMPDRPSFDATGESVVAEVFRAGDTGVFDDLRTVDDPFDYGDVRATMIVPIGEHGTISVADIEVGTIGEFDRRLIEVLSTYACLVLDHLEHERALVTAKDEAEEADRFKTTMLANMSHEIRTPLTSVTGFSEILRDSLEGEMQDFADKILKSGKRLQKTLDAVLELSELEAGTKNLAEQPVSLKRVAEGAVDLFRPDAEAQGIDLTVDPEPSVHVLGDEAALSQIAKNLVENAVKFTPNGGRITVRVRTNGDTGILEVEDTGIGIGTDALPDIFEAFKQESEGLDREFEGSGLGLPIVRDLTHAMDGTVNVETTKGRGSRFTVHVPSAGPKESES